MAPQTNTTKIAYALTERDGKTYWNKIGVAFENRDGSLTITLDALPVSGRLQLRDDDPRERDDRDGVRRR